MDPLLIWCYITSLTLSMLIVQCRKQYMTLMQANNKAALQVG